MRDKIVIMEKGAYKTAERPPVKKNKKNREKRIKREMQILEKTNNALMAISLESTVGSC
jgi:hypothetical protein